MEKKEINRLGYFILICIFVIFIVYLFTGNKSSQPQVKETIIFSKSFNDFSIICDSGATNLQKQEAFKKFKNQYVEWSGKVSSISESSFGSGYTLQVKHCPSTFISDIMVTMKEDQKYKLLKYKEGDKITYRAKLTRLGDILGLSADEGEIIE